MAEPDSSAPYPWKLKWFTVVVGTLYAGYQITNRWQWREPSTLPLTWLDRNVPLLEWTIWPYLVLAGCISLLILVQDRALFRRSLAALIIGYSINLIVFAVWPTMLPRGTLPDGPHGACFQWLYSLDSPANCFPSGHITAPLIGFYALTVQHPRHRGLLWLAFALLCPAILTTKQHYAADLAGGLATGAIGIWAAGHWMGRSEEKTAGPDRPGKPVFNGGLVNLIKFQRNPLKFLTEVTERCGPVVQCRLAWLHPVIVSDPEAAHAVLRLPPRAANKKTRSVGRLERISGLSLLTANGDSWFRLRRLVQPAFHHQRIEEYRTVLTGLTTEMIAEWQAQPGCRIEAGAAMRRLTFRFMCRVILGAGTPAETRSVEQSIAKLLAAAWESIQSPFDLRWRLPTKHRREFDAALHHVRTFIRDRIGERRVPGAATDDLLSMLMAVRDADTGLGMNDGEIINECITLLIAGFDTTANALTWALILLARHPDKAAALREEAAAGGPAPLARAAFMETLRLYPPIWIIERNLETTVTAGAWHLEAGSQILISPWVLHRSPAHWEHPDQFDPSRFLDPAKDYPAWLAFGAGPRACIGRSLAMMEGPAVLSMIARAGNVVLEGEVPEPDPGIALRPGGEVWITLTGGPRD